MRFRVDTRSRAWLVSTVASSLAAGTLLAALVSPHLLRPLPFPSGDSLFAVAERQQGASESGPMSGGTAEDVRTRARSVAQLGTYSASEALLTAGDLSTSVQLVYASEHLFEALGVRPLAGVPFASTCDLPRQVFLSERIWRSRFDGRERIIGDSVQIAGRPFTVAGVIASASALPRNGDLWTCDPLGRPMGERERRDRYRFGVARLRPGTALGEAQREVGQLSARLAEEHPGSNQGWKIELSPLRVALLGGSYDPLLLIAVLAPLILVLGAINVAGAVAALMEANRGRWQLEAALGARLRQVGIPLARSLFVLLGAGVATAALIVETGFRLVRPLATQMLPFGGAIGWDASTRLFLIGGAVIMGVLATAIGLHLVVSAHQHPEAVLTGEGSRHYVGLGRLRHSIVGGQLAVASFVVFLGVWLLSNYARLASAGVGYEAADLLVADVSLQPSAALPRPWSHLAQATPELIAAVESDARVTAAGVGSLPPASNGVEVTLVADDSDVRTAHATAISVSAGFFADIGANLIHGRDFGTDDSFTPAALDNGDARASEGVIVLSDRTARTLWGSGPYLGRRVRLQPSSASWRVVGIVGTLGGQVAPEQVIRVYVPFAQAPRIHFNLLIRLAPNVVLTDLELRRMVAAAAPRLAITRVRRMSDILQSETRLPLALTGGATAVAIVALLLSLAGVYSLSQYVTRRQAPALAVRVALGSTPLRSAGAAVEHQRPALLIGAAGGLLLTWLWMRLFTPDAAWLAPASLQQFAGVSAAMLLAAAVAAAHPSWLLARGPVARLLQQSSSTS
ncbi:ABC transporter permease [Luteitalea sp.]|uniref:ABC transporter permease n=1 Tax=Luteitalea sp. TaxID=2004800 RepID=UPI0025C55861|nr:ABC transporter permease [Luteitalea sp.]